MYSKLLSFLLHFEDRSSAVRYFANDVIVYLQSSTFPIQVEKKRSPICSRFFVSKFCANSSRNL